mgnify:CR=1 FL=1
MLVEMTILEHAKTGLKVAGAAILCVPLGIANYGHDMSYLKEQLDIATNYLHNDVRADEIKMRLAQISPLSEYIASWYRNFREARD